MKKVIKNSIIIIVILGIALAYSFGTWGKNIYVQTASSGDNQLTNELTGDIEIAQTFLCPYSGLNSIKIKMLRVGSENVEGYSWHVSDKNGQVVAEGVIDQEQLNERAFTKKKFLTLEIPEQKNSKGMEYTLSITGTDVKKEGCLQAYVSEGNQYAKQLSINGKTFDTSMILKMNMKRFNVETFLVFMGLVGYVWLFFKFMYKLFK